MKRIKLVGLTVFTSLFLFGVFFVWQVLAQDSADSGKGISIYLPWISSNRTQTEAANVSTVVSDTQWILKPGEYEGFAPTPFPDIPLPDDVKPVTPGQPVGDRPRPSPEELATLGEIHISPNAPYVVYTVADHFTDSKSAALMSHTIVIAKVRTIHPSRWNSSDGKRPANPFDFDHPSYIYTQVDIEVQEILQGTAKSGEILPIFMNGGRVGDDMLVVETYVTEFVDGQTLFLYLDPITVDFPGNYWRVNERYTIDPSGKTAANPVETRSLDDLRAEVIAAQKQRQQDMAQQP